MQHLVIFVLHLAINELLPIDAVVGKTARNRCETLSLRSVSAKGAECHSDQTAYVKSSAHDNSLEGLRNRFQITSLKDGFHISPKAHLGDNWILWRLLVATPEKQLPLTYPNEVVSMEFCVFLVILLLVSQL